MKLPVFKNLAKNVSIEAMEIALEVLEVYADSPAVKEPEQEVIGEMISNICGASFCQYFYATCNGFD